MKNHTYGYIYAVLAAFFFALIAIIGKTLIAGGSHPFQVSFYQYLFTMVLLGTWLMLRKRSELRAALKKFPVFALFGIVGGSGATLFFYSALQYLDAGVTSMIFFINPVYVTIFFAITKIRKIKPLNYISAALAIIGAAIVLDVFAGAHSFHILGIAFAIMSGVCYAFYNIFADLKFKSEDPNIINFYACSASLIFNACLLATSGVGFAIKVTDLPPILFLAAFSGILPVYFIIKAFHYIGSEKVSVIATIELPMTLIMAFTILKEQMRPIQLFGVLLIIISAVLLHRNEEK